jgi:dipeptidyl aminopeptidase/acylaminoacyl peptidase
MRDHPGSFFRIGAAMNSMKAFLYVLVFAVASMVGCKSSSQQSNGPSQAGRDLAEFRASHPTHLVRHGPPPESWRSTEPLTLPANVDEVVYQSDGLALKAWISRVPNDGNLHPAVVFCHGGFWFGQEDWTTLKPFLDAGFVVMTPRVRAENGNPGDFEYYFGEVNDVIAAGRYVASLKGIDKSRIFVSGHSAGGELAALAVLFDNPFSLSAPIGVRLDMGEYVQMQDPGMQSLVVFDRTNADEVQARSAVMFISSLRTPVHFFQGKYDQPPPMLRFVDAAKKAGKPAEATIVPGDHFRSLLTAIPNIVRLFQDYKR